VANSIITGSFVHRSSLPVDLALIIALGAVTAAAHLAIASPAWRRPWLRCWRPLMCSFLSSSTSAGEFGFPIVFPAWSDADDLRFPHHLRVVFEQTERRRVTTIFGTVVSKKNSERNCLNPRICRWAARGEK